MFHVPDRKPDVDDILNKSFYIFQHSLKDYVDIVYCQSIAFLNSVGSTFEIYLELFLGLWWIVYNVLNLLKLIYKDTNSQLHTQNTIKTVKTIIIYDPDKQLTRRFS